MAGPCAGQRIAAIQPRPAHGSVDPTGFLSVIAATRYPITASIGIASVALGPSFDPAERELIDDLVNVADKAMYAAKSAGGDQSRSTHIAHAALKGSAA